MWVWPKLIISHSKTPLVQLKKVAPRSALGSHRFKEICRALSLSTLLSSRRSMVRCPWLCARRWWLKLLNFPDLPRIRPLVSVAMVANLSARSFPFTPVCLGQCTHRSFRRWVSTIATFQSELPILLFVTSSLNLRGRLHVWSAVTSSGNPAEGTCVCFHLHCQAGG